jgi:hypothetical protein
MFFNENFFSIPLQRTGMCASIGLMKMTNTYKQKNQVLVFININVYLWQKLKFSVFLSQKYNIFCYETKHVRRKSQYEKPRGVKEDPPCVLLPSYMQGGAHLPPRGSFSDFFASMDSTSPKIDYIYDPSGNFMTGYRIHETDLNAARKAGRCCWSRFQLPFASIDIISFITMIKGSSSSLYYEIVEVNCITLSIVLH